MGLVHWLELETEAKSDGVYRYSLPEYRKDPFAHWFSFVVLQSGVHSFLPYRAYSYQSWQVSSRCTCTKVHVSPSLVCFPTKDFFPPPQFLVLVAEKL